MNPRIRRGGLALLTYLFVLTVFGGAMTGTQLISIFLVLIGGALWLRRKKLPETAVARASH